MSNRKVLFAGIFTVLILAFGTAQSPAKVLTQPLMDRFLTDMPTVMSDTKVSAAWEAGTQAVLMESITNPSSGIMMGQVLYDDVYNMQKAICRKMKADAGVASVLSGKKWKAEFWDVYLVMVIGLSYAHNRDIENNPELAEVTGALDFSGMPPSGKYLHADDMALIQANLSRIEGSIGDEISAKNGY